MEELGRLPPETPAPYPYNVSIARRVSAVVHSDASRRAMRLFAESRRITAPTRSSQAEARNGRIDAHSHVCRLADSRPHPEDSRSASDGDANEPSRGILSWSLRIASMSPRKCTREKAEASR